MHEYTFMISPICRVSVNAESEVEAQQKIARLTHLPYDSAPPLITRKSQTTTVSKYKGHTLTEAFNELSTQSTR